MRQSILTQYRGPTNASGSRILASCDAGRLVMPYRHDLDVQDNHAEAASLLAARLGWSGIWAGGSLPGNKGYAFVDVSSLQGGAR